MNTIQELEKEEAARLTALRKVPAFQKNGAFSLDAYNDQMKDYQMALHITPDAGADPIAATKTCARAPSVNASVGPA